MTDERRRAADFNIGDTLWEGSYSAGKIVSMMDCPKRSTRMYMLLRNDNNEYTIYSCLKDAVTSPVVSRLIPEAVVFQFFHDAFMRDIGIPDFTSQLVDIEPDKTPVKEKDLSQLWKSLRK